MAEKNRVGKRPVAGTRQRGWKGPASAGLALLVLAVSCVPESPAPDAGTQAVEIVEVGPAETRERREYLGTLAAAPPVELAFRVPGRIAEVSPPERRAVEAGDVIVRLEPDRYRSRVVSARADLAKARFEFDRAQTLFEEGEVNAAEPDRRRATFDRFESRFRAALQDLEDTELRAPFAGRVTRMLARPTEQVQEGQPVALLRDDSRFEIQVSVPERDLDGDTERTALQAAWQLRARVVVGSTPGAGLEASVIEVSPLPDETKAVVQVRFAFDRPSEPVEEDTAARVVVELPRAAGRPEPPSLPAEAAQTDERGRSYVWRVDRSSLRVHKANVELVERRGGPPQVLSGLTRGDWVAVSGLRELREGMRVRRVAR